MENDEVKKMSLCGHLIRRIREIQILLIFLIITGAGQNMLSAQETSAGKFKQRLEWSADKNAFEYKVEIRSGEKTVKTFTTSENYVNLNLPAGSYDYRVTVYDFLGREQDISAWQKFEISKANAPAFSNVEENFEVDVSSSGKIVLPVEVDNVAEGASVALVNVKTGEKIKGALVLSAVAGAAVGGKSEIAKASAEFPKIAAGEWKLVVTNPSGLSSESQAIAVKTVDKEKERREAEKAAKEAAELAAKEERERLAREEAERKAAEKEAQKEAERLAKEQKEKEKMAAKELQSNNMYILAEDDEEDDEDFESTPEIEIAEAPEPEDEEVKEPEKTKRPPHKILGIEVKAGGSAVINLFDSDLLGLKNYDTLTQGAMPENITLAPLVSISYVPNLSWRFKPGLEISADGFVYENRSAAFGDNEWEYNQKFCYNNVQAALIGQLRLLSDKIFLNAKAGGGLTEILISTEYVGDREATLKAFTYPKLNAGLSLELVPLKYLVIELGADYNRILSSKINFSYLKPYLEVGVRF